jgi:hypothetical protein
MIIAADVVVAELLGLQRHSDHVLAEANGVGYIIPARHVGASTPNFIGCTFRGERTSGPYARERHIARTRSEGASGRLHIESVK